MQQRLRKKKKDKNTSSTSLITPYSVIYSAGSVTPLGYSLICLFTCTNSLAQGVYTAIPVLHTHVCFVLVLLEDSASAGLNWLSVCLYCVCHINNAP